VLVNPQATKAQRRLGHRAGVADPRGLPVRRVVPLPPGPQITLVHQRGRPQREQRPDIVALPDQRHDVRHLRTSRVPIFDNGPARGQPDVRYRTGVAPATGLRPGLGVR
jgi:hypothetical protein